MWKVSCGIDSPSNRLKLHDGIERTVNDMKGFTLLLLLPAAFLSFSVDGEADHTEAGTAEPDSFFRWGNDFGLFAEGAIGFGSISHDFNDDSQEQFGYSFREGCEQNGAYLRLGIGKGFGSYGGYLYGELGTLGSGFAIFDNHGPYIPPEIRMKITELSIGVEFRVPMLRVRTGLGNYSGSATVQEDDDTTLVANPGAYNTDLAGGSGWHYAIGLAGRNEAGLMLGLEWIQHFFSVQLEENGMGTETTEHRARQSEVRIFGGYEFSL
jgi:hypothetical protein